MRPHESVDDELAAVGVVVALLGVSLLGEHLTALQWFGVGLITLGAICMAL